MKNITIFLFSLIFLFSFSSFSQEEKKTPTGLGLEAGMGYNMMTLSGTDSTGNFVSNFNRFWMQPCLRVHYDIKLKEFGKKNSLKVKVFLGYYTFGGKIKLNDKGEFNILSFASIEGGAGLSIDINNMFQISPLFKAQYVMTATERYIRETSHPSTDVKDITNRFCYNAGMQLRFKYRHFTVGLEGWYGLADIHNKSDKIAKENNFRLLIGFEF